MKDIIEQYLSNWEFEEVKKIYKCGIENKTIDKNDYYIFLYYIGDYDSLNRLFLKESKKFIFLNYTVDIWLDLFDCIKNAKDIESILSYKDLNQNLLNIIHTKYKNGGGEQTLANYFLQKHLTSYKEISVVYCTNLFMKYILPAQHSISTDFFMQKLIRYCVMFDDKYIGLFFPKAQCTPPYYFLTKLFDRNNPGAKLYYNLFCEKIQEYLNSRIFKIKNSLRISFCFYGIFRGEWKATLEKNIKQIINVFGNNVDIFIFSWDEYQEWPGFCGGWSWIERLFPEFEKFATDDIRINNLFLQKFPNVSKKISTQYHSTINTKDLEELQAQYSQIKLFSLERQQDFKYHQNSNVFKLYYGMYKCFELMKEYQVKNRVKSDCVFLLRNDYEYIFNQGVIDSITQIKYNEIYEMHFSCGTGNGLCYGKSNVVEKYVSFYHNLEFVNENYINKIDNHESLFKWMVYHGIKTKKSEYFFYYNKNTLCLQGLKIPSVYYELFLDKQIITKKQKKEVEYFFEKLYDKFGCLECSTSHLVLYRSAKSRIQNQLSYKLGQAMIANSKSLLGYIRMPFILSYIKYKHKQEQKIYQEKIKQNPSLKLPPLESYSDYKEALKEKECLTYKLGKALIQANKTWYKGGYVKLCIFLIFVIKAYK